MEGAFSRDEISRILEAGQGEKSCAIGLITTDDFYGFYLSWEYTDNIDEYYDWEQGSEPDFLYQPLVDIVDSCEEINFCNPPDEKWEFAKALLAVLDKTIRAYGLDRRAE